MPVSKELQDAIRETESLSQSAVSHVGAANYAEREREAKKWVRSAFGKVYSLIDTEDQRISVQKWRDAVAAGETMSSYVEWSAASKS